MPARLLLLIAIVPFAAAAHAPGEAGARGWWSLDPWVLVPWLTIALGYACGLLRLWRRARLGRGVRAWQALCFIGGMSSLFLALIWPLEVLSAHSFAAHMTQHMLLMLLAAPLLVAGMPLPVLLFALPPRWRRQCGAALRHASPLRRLWRAVCHPPIAFLLHAIAVWAWHAPPAFELALRYNSVHILEHLSFLVTGMMFWWSVFAHGRRDPGVYGSGALWVLATLVHTGLLGAIITFAPAPLYPAYAEAGRLGLSLLEDQQLAGLIMWVPGSFLYMVAGLLLTALWLNGSERQAALSRRSAMLGGAHAIAKRGESWSGQRRI
jgi:putative membrane protein